MECAVRKNKGRAAAWKKEKRKKTGGEEECGLHISKAHIRRQREQKKAVQNLSCIGIAGGAPSVGSTHFSILTAAYLSGVQQKKTVVLEWERTDTFVNLEKILSKKVVTNEKEHTFNILGIFFCRENGQKALLSCMEQGFETVVIDFGCCRESFLEEFLRCDRKFLVCSGSDWQTAASIRWMTGEYARRWRVEYVASFGAEETLRMAETYLKVPIRRIPFSPDAFAVNGEIMDFFGRFLKYG